MCVRRALADRRSAAPGRVFRRNPTSSGPSLAGGCGGVPLATDETADRRSNLHFQLPASVRTLIAGGGAMRRRFTTGLLFALTMAAPAVASAAIDPETKVALDTIWVLVTAFLVFWMNAGFALVESGLCRSKNAVNILSKNFIVFAISSIAFYVIGWGIMFGDGNPFFGIQGLFMLTGADNSPATGDAYKGVYSSMNWTGVPLYAKFFFQLVFAGTAAKIV